MAKELIDEIDVLWVVGDVGPLGFQSGSFYRYADKDRARKGSVAVWIGWNAFATSRAFEFSVLYSIERTHQNERSLGIT
jgi:hypothetical protein